MSDELERDADGKTWVERARGWDTALDKAMAPALEKFKAAIEPDALTSLRQATVWLEAAAVWRKNHPDEDVFAYLESRARAARAAVERLEAAAVHKGNEKETT